jgi:glutathione S-transferase
MYKLYGTKGSGTCAVKAALTEAGAPFEEVEITTSKKQHLTEEYRQINPRQQVPSLMLPDGSIMTEGSAMLLHIADAHPELGLAPAPGTPERAQHDRWLIFFAVNVYEGMLRNLMGERYTTDGNGKQGVEEAARAYVDRHFSIFEESLADGPYFFGDNFSMLDIYMWMIAQWMDASWLEANCPKITRLADTVKVRPKIVPIHEENFGA